MTLGGAWKRRFAVVGALAFSILGIVSRASYAAGTSPTLALVAADAFASEERVRLVTVAGASNFDDLVQAPFPAAGLLVTQGTRFARYDVDGSVREGDAQLVADGIDPAELATLLSLGTLAAPPARLARIAASEVSVVLPPGFEPREASVVLFALHEDEAFVSNAIVLVLP
ncbi:MAG: hypothetical protein AB1689_21735 [Thermodesulfobacteriota bacterium]